MTRTLIAVLCVVMLSACGGTRSSANANPIAALQEIKRAEAALAKANASGFGWRDTDALLKEAKAANEGRDYGKAYELAMQARTQAEAALAQSTK